MRRNGDMSPKWKIARRVTDLNDVVAWIVLPGMSSRIPMTETRLVKIERDLTCFAWIENDSLETAKFVDWARNR
jgi:hypothetical protein